MAITTKNLIGQPNIHEIIRNLIIPPQILEWIMDTFCLVPKRSITICKEQKDVMHLLKL